MENHLSRSTLIGMILVWMCSATLSYMSGLRTFIRIRSLFHRPSARVLRALDCITIIVMILYIGTAVLTIIPLFIRMIIMNVTVILYWIVIITGLSSYSISLLRALATAPSPPRTPATPLTPGTPRSKGSLSAATVRPWPIGGNGGSGSNIIASTPMINTNNNSVNVSPPASPLVPSSRVPQHERERLAAAGGGGGVAAGNATPTTFIEVPSSVASSIDVVDQLHHRQRMGKANIGSASPPQLSTIVSTSSLLNIASHSEESTPTAAQLHATTTDNDAAVAAAAVTKMTTVDETATTMITSEEKVLSDGAISSPHPSSPTPMPLTTPNATNDDGDEKHSILVPVLPLAPSTSNDTTIMMMPSITNIISPSSMTIPSLSIRTSASFVNESKTPTHGSAAMIALTSSTTLSLVSSGALSSRPLSLGSSRSGMITLPGGGSGGTGLGTITSHHSRAASTPNGSPSLLTIRRLPPVSSAQSSPMSTKATSASSSPHFLFGANGASNLVIGTASTIESVISPPSQSPSSVEPSSILILDAPSSSPTATTSGIPSLLSSDPSQSSPSNGSNSSVSSSVIPSSPSTSTVAVTLNPKSDTTTTATTLVGSSTSGNSHTVDDNGSLSLTITMSPPQRDSPLLSLQTPFELPQGAAVSVNNDNKVNDDVAPVSSGNHSGQTTSTNNNNKDTSNNNGGSGPQSPASPRTPTMVVIRSPPHSNSNTPGVPPAPSSAGAVGGYRRARAASRSIGGGGHGRLGGYHARTRSAITGGNYRGSYGGYGGYAGMSAAELFGRHGPASPITPGSGTADINSSGGGGSGSPLMPSRRSLPPTATLSTHRMALTAAAVAAANNGNKDGMTSSMIMKEAAMASMAAAALSNNGGGSGSVRTTLAGMLVAGLSGNNIPTTTPNGVKNSERARLSAHRLIRLIRSLQILSIVIIIGVIVQWVMDPYHNRDPYWIIGMLIYEQIRDIVACMIALCTWGRRPARFAQLPGGRVLPSPVDVQSSQVGYYKDNNNNGGSAAIGALTSIAIMTPSSPVAATTSSGGGHHTNIMMTPLGVTATAGGISTAATPRHNRHSRNPSPVGRTNINHNNSGGNGATDRTNVPPTPTDGVVCIGIASPTVTTSSSPNLSSPQGGMTTPMTPPLVTNRVLVRQSTRQLSIDVGDLGGMIDSYTLQQLRQQQNQHHHHGHGHGHGNTLLRPNPNGNGMMVATHAPTLSSESTSNSSSTASSSPPSIGRTLGSTTPSTATIAATSSTSSNDNNAINNNINNDIKTNNNHTRSLSSRAKQRLPHANLSVAIAVNRRAS
jgi:hypothetical protein